VERWQETFPATARSVRAIRDQLASVAGRCGLSESQVADVRLAVSEAATNAVVHGCRSSATRTVTAMAQAAGGELCVVIGDDGAGMSPRPDSPGLGLGLPLIAMLTIGLEVAGGEEGGTQIRMRFPCPATS
jgi:serine/threonine-protein kinase RsbW/stage II sporulation protein AB (anti-sigma F factor)